MFSYNEYFVSVQSQDLDFLHHMLWSFYTFSELRWEMIVRFVDIIGIVDHNCISFLFIILHCVIEIQTENCHPIIIVRFILSITKSNPVLFFLAQDIYLNVSYVRHPLNIKPIRIVHRQTYCLLNQSTSTFTLHWRVIIEWIFLINKEGSEDKIYNFYETMVIYSVTLLWLWSI